MKYKIVQIDQRSRKVGRPVIGRNHRGELYKERGDKQKCWRYASEDLRWQ